MKRGVWWGALPAGTFVWERPAGAPHQTIPAAECLRVTPSKDWGRKFDDPLATKQRYYCSCSRRFNATWGQIVEISRCTHGGSVERMYVRADVPSWDVEDIRAMSLERTLDPANPRALYDQVRRVEPSVDDVIIKDTEGHKHVRDMATYVAMPVFRWVEIFNLAGVEAPLAVRKAK